jgi:hypothetical protein
MGSNKIEHKLQRVERTINIYKLNNKMVDEINIDHIPFEMLKRIVNPKEDDPLLYDGYILNAQQLENFNRFIDNKIVNDFELYFYVLECSGIYD